MFRCAGFIDSFHVRGGRFEVSVVRFMVGFITVCSADWLGLKENGRYANSLDLNVIQMKVSTVQIDVFENSASICRQQRDGFYEGFKTRRICRQQFEDVEEGGRESTDTEEALGNQKKEEIEIERSAPQQSETRLSTYEVVQLVPQDFYCISTPISATVELSHEHYLAQLHFQCCLPGCMLNCISETRK